MKEKQSSGKNVFYAAAACGGILLFAITYLTVRKQMGIAGADVTRHVDWALQLDFWKELVPFIPYPLFHILVKGIIRITALDKALVAAVVSGLINVLTYVLILYFLETGLPEGKRRKSGLCGILAFIFLVVQAIYIPAFNDKLYLGQGSINIWHNPTYAIVRPCGILAFLIVLEMLRLQGQEKRIAFTKWWWSLLFAMILCNLAKPSFSQVFIPGLGLYMIMDVIRTKGKSLAFHFQIACAFIPATILLFLQASLSLGAGVCFEWMEVWNSYTRDPYVSILLLMAFPVYVICIDAKEFFAKTDAKLSCFIFVAGYFEAALLAEDSARKYSGNFFWGYYLGALVVWISAFRHFLESMYIVPWRDRTTAYKIKVMAGWGIFLLHVISGIYYLYCHIAVAGFWF